MPQIQDVLDRAKGRGGRTALAAALASRTGSTKTVSGAEERFLELVRAAELPAPECNVSLCGYSVDFLWREAAVVFEVDGYRFHTSRFAFNRDRRKDGVLKAAGFDPSRVSAEQVEDAPYAVVARVAQALAVAQAQLRRHARLDDLDRGAS